MQGKDDQLTIIDGSYGQGGGRISRTFLALSAIDRKPATLLDNRTNRNNPAIRLRPFKGLKALVHVPGARVDGVRMGSQTVHTAFQKRGERQSEGSMETSSA